MRPTRWCCATLLPGADALYTAAATRAFDRRAIERHGLPGIVLMRRAGAAAFEFLRDRWPDAEVLTICCGRGNNAGDALCRGWHGA